MVGSLAPIGTSILLEILWKAGKWIANKSRTIRSKKKMGFLRNDKMMYKKNSELIA